MRTITNLDLTPLNSYKLRSFCAKAFFPEKEEDILMVYKNNPGRRIIVLGNGNNIILSKEYYEDYFLILNGNFDNIKVNGNELICEAGVTMLQLSEIALENRLTGLEIFYDIPGSVGGVVVMNAGAGDEEIRNLVTRVRYLDLNDMQVKEMRRDEMEFEYRSSYFQKNPGKIVLKAWFILADGIYEQIKEKMETTKRMRWSKQPREYPNCGSVFKRPPGKFVGPMIDQLGLRGYTVGGAQISEKHSGFIINRGNATGKDIIRLITIVKRKVFEEFGINIDVEQKII